MNITSVTIDQVVDNGTPLKAVASVTFDKAFMVHNIKLIKSRGKIFTVFPCKGREHAFESLAHPIASDLREKIEKAIIVAYNEFIKKQTIKGEKQWKTPN